MPDLTFQIESAEAVPHSAAPQIAFRLRVSAPAGAAVHAVALRCQVRIDPALRSYGAADKARLRALFGDAPQWERTLKSLLWAHASAMVPAFEGAASVELPVPCTFDFNIAAARYFDGLADGEVPLTFLFSGTIFHAGADGALQIAQIPWDKEARFRLPVAVWRQMMAHYYPDCAWLCLRKDVFDRLDRYKNEGGLPTWEQALESLLAAAAEGGRP